MSFTQIDLIRVLEGVDLKLAVDAILSSTVYQDGILAPQKDLVTAIENILFDQLGQLDELVPQFKEFFAQNIRSLVAYVSGNPLAAGSDYPSESISIFGELVSYLIPFLQPSDDQKTIDDLKETIKNLNTRLKKAERVIEEYRNSYYDRWKSGRSSPTGNFYQRVYNILTNVQRGQGL